MRRQAFRILVLGLVSLASPSLAVTAGSFADGGNTLVSGMMLFVGNEEKVYILDKAEGNAAQINGHPAWGAVWDINSHQTQVMDVSSNSFCSSGMHLPNGSYVSLGGNSAVGRGASTASEPGVWDSVYQDFDGGKSIRILSPCTSTDDFTSPQCTWFDDSTLLSMTKRRWYSAAEALADGTIAIIGGFVNGGYINRNYPNVDPEFEGNPPAAECTYEFYPSKGNATPLQFLINTSGLNAYAHTFLMASGLMFVQANVSTMLWDYNTNTETPLPPMPNNVVRVYPASGAVAMLPLTPANNYTPTLIFCGGSDMPDAAWGNYSFPAINTWLYPASNDCHRITPEPTDASTPAYTRDDDMLEGRSMGQFIILPNGKLLVVNGGLNGTAGYAQATGQTPSFADMPFGESLASGPVGTPAIYDPDAPVGSRWSNTGFSSSNIARLYHSSAILLPDASVLIAGSNPNFDVNTSTVFSTEYRAEIFYPPYFSSGTRPAPQNVPTKLTYGGDYFNITIPSSSYSGAANDAADNTTVVIQRGGFTTHAMNMGQRLMQLNNTYTVNNNGSITLHVSQPPPNPNIFQPGPAFLFVNIYAIPSNGTYLILGTGNFGTQPTAAASPLPPVLRLSVTGSASSSSPDDSMTSGGGSAPDTASTSHIGVIVGVVVGGIAAMGIIAALVGIWICISRRKKSSAATTGTAAGGSATYPMTTTTSMPAGGVYSPSIDNWSAVGLTQPVFKPYQDDDRDGGSSADEPFTPRFGAYHATS